LKIFHPVRVQLKFTFKMLDAAGNRLNSSPWFGHLSALQPGVEQRWNHGYRAAQPPLMFYGRGANNTSVETIPSRN